MCGGRDSVDDPDRPPRPRRRNGRADVRLQNLNITGPVTPPGSVPALERDDHGMWRQYEQRELSRQNILRALAYAAEYLHDHGESVTLVAVGGAVNTVLLQSRNTTHDVDFFSLPLSGNGLRNLREAGHYAIERSSVPLSEDWLNNATARMPGVVEHVQELTQAALAQNDIVFEGPGLKVLAAPWLYAFVKKVSRITQGTGRVYDASDAVGYLYQYNSRRGHTAVRVEVIREHASHYRALAPDEILRQVDASYQQTHGHPGIAWPL